MRNVGLLKYSDSCMSYLVGVDIGGTFTDCAVLDESGLLTIGKALSTPDDFANGVIDAVADAAQALQLGAGEARDLLSKTRLFIHACTVGDNTLLTRSGLPTAIVTTRGFADTFLMMRGKIAEGLTETEVAHLSELEKPTPIIERRRIVEVTERVDRHGNALVDLDLEDAAETIDRLVAEGVQSIAICLLWAFKNTAHEQRLKALVKERHPDVYVTCSHEVAPFPGEYERTATTAFNAYIGPVTSAYLRRLSGLLHDNGLETAPVVMQAYGGVLSLEATAENSVGIIESGPAAGIVASRHQGELVGDTDILATDMGGTTFKAGVIRKGRLEKEFHPVFMRHTIMTSKVWVESIGAGGGSIAWIDEEHGLLRVGPAGAGSLPGPVCYMQGGTEPTVADADVTLGYLNPDYFLGGKMKLDKAGAEKAIEEKIAKPLGLSVTEAAAGIYRIANSHMADLLRKATIERGYDPRTSVVYSTGGAAGVHAARFAADLGVKEIVVPPTASVQGAAGLVTSDAVYEYGVFERHVLPLQVAALQASIDDLAGRGRKDLAGVGFGPEVSSLQFSADMRYRFQAHELNIDLNFEGETVTAADVERLADEFDRRYEMEYGAGATFREAGMELVALRLAATGKLPRPELRPIPAAEGGVDDAKKGERDAFFEEYGEFRPTPVYDYGLLGAGSSLDGPAIIETPVTTIVVNPGQRAGVDKYGNVRVELRP